jgi:hypothetical protein
MAADVVLQGAYYSSSNLQIRLQPRGGGSFLFTSFSTLKLDDEVDPQLVKALGSYGAIGSTDGTYKASGEFSGPTQVIQYLFDALSAADPTGSKSPSKTEFTITGIISNGIDPNYKLEVRRCKAMKRNDDFASGDPKPLVQTVPLLIIDGIYRNGIRLLNQQPGLGIR